MLQKKCMVLVVLALFATTFVFGCSSDESSEMTGWKYKQDSLIGPEGGRIELPMETGIAAVIIPTQALSQPTVITLGVRQDTALAVEKLNPTGALSLLSEVVTLLPEGLEFNEMVEIEIPHTPTDNNFLLYVLEHEDDPTWKLAPVISPAIDGLVQLPSKHFSSYAVASDNSPKETCSAKYVIDGDSWQSDKGKWECSGDYWAFDCPFNSPSDSGCFCLNPEGEGQMKIWGGGEASQRSAWCTIDRPNEAGSLCLDISCTPWNGQSKSGRQCFPGNFYYPYALSEQETCYFSPTAEKCGEKCTIDMKPR